MKAKKALSVEINFVYSDNLFLKGDQYVILSLK